VNTNTPDKEHVLAQRVYPPSISSASTDWWSMLGHDSARTGFSTSTAPETNHTLFIRDLSPYATVFGGISIGNGKLYISSFDKHLYCLDAYSGELLFDHANQGLLISVPVIDTQNNRIYFGSYDHNFYCLDSSTGQQIWTVTTNDVIKSSPAFFNNLLYIGGMNGKVMCFNKNGTEQWNQSYSGSIPNSLAVAQVGTSTRVFFGNTMKEFGCLNAVDGSWFWGDTYNGNMSTPVVVLNKVYVACDDNHVYCFNAVNGGVLWSFPMSFDKNSLMSPVVGTDKVFIGSTDGKFYCINATTGVKQWEYQTSSAIRSTPAVADGKIYFGDAAGTIYCIQADTGALLWTYTDLFSTVQSAFAVSNGIVYAAGNGKVYAFGTFTDEPPVTPVQPSGTTSGDINVQYTYTTSTTDSENDPIYYQWQFGTTTTTWIGPFSSGTLVEQHFAFTNPGTYDIRVKAKDQYNQESPWSTPLSIAISEAPSNLVITTPSSVIENGSFVVTVTTGTTPLNHTTISFLTGTYFTNASGKVTLSAPSVERDTPFTLTANHEGYTASTKTITVLNNPEQPGDRGWAFGVVYDSSGIPLEGATICFLLSTDQTSVSRDCTFTDDQGRFNSKPTLIGTYTIEATKDGYQAQTKQIILQKNMAQEVDFTLEKSETPSSTTHDPIDYTIRYGIQNNIIGAQIIIPEKEPQITVYNQNLAILDSTIEQGTFQFTITGSEGTQRTVIALRLDDPQTVLKTPIENLQDLKITIDGQTIEMASNVGDIFTPIDTKPHWAGFIAGEKVYILIGVTHFSEHTITISLTPQLTSLFSMILYVAVGIIAGTIFLSRFYARPLFLTYFRKKKQ
jgi:eukaryotic-like serine/threonine-protein kinase